MERSVHFAVKNGKLSFNVEITFDVTNIQHQIREVFVLKKLLKNFNEHVMPEIFNYPTKLIEEELKEYLNESTNLIVTEVKVANLKSKEMEL